MRKNIIAVILFLMVLAGCIVYPTRGSLVATYPPGAVVYYSNPPLPPGYPFLYWYTLPSQPGFVFFFSNKHKHHQHRWDGDPRRRGFDRKR